MTITHADIPRFYIEVNNHPIAVRDFREWYSTYEHSDPLVATSWLDVGPESEDKIHVSTIFLGYSQDPTASPPLLYETCVYQGTQIRERVLSESRDAAQDVHEQIVESLTALQ